jgi:ADP-ribosylglycohydrolase
MKEIFIKIVNYGGDCDTFGAIAMQIAGAYFGIQDWMIYLYKEKLEKDYDKYNKTPIE